MVFTSMDGMAMMVWLGWLVALACQRGAIGKWPVKIHGGLSAPPRGRHPTLRFNNMKIDVIWKSGAHLTLTGSNTFSEYDNIFVNKQHIKEIIRSIRCGRCGFRLERVKVTI